MAQARWKKRAGQQRLRQFARFARGTRTTRAKKKIMVNRSVDLP
jgi:hypothetical protein